MTFDLDLYLQGHSTLFWLGIQHDSILWVIMKRRGVSSERKRSSCSSFIYAWTKGWVNNWDASGLRHHHTHYDVTVINESQEQISYHENAFKTIFAKCQHINEMKLDLNFAWQSIHLICYIRLWCIRNLLFKSYKYISIFDKKNLWIFSMLSIISYCLWFLFIICMP